MSCILRFLEFTFVYVSESFSGTINSFKTSPSRRSYKVILPFISLVIRYRPDKLIEKLLTMFSVLKIYVWYFFYFDRICCEYIPDSDSTIVATGYHQVWIAHKLCFQNIFSVSYVYSLGCCIISDPKLGGFICRASQKEVSRFIKINWPYCP